MDSTNNAYRNVDIQRWQNMDFVIGYEIHLSNNPDKDCDICKRLAGKYPKSFNWCGWHDGCKCHVTPIFMDDDDFDNNELAELRSALYGKKHKKRTPKNAVKFLPKTFLDWWDENSKKIFDSGGYPYFYTDNILLILDSHTYYKIKEL